jgi:4-amino-4-deoxy-L-arabinose transferase-like glycosyltransferase
LFRPQPAADGLIVIEQARALLESGRMPLLTYYPPLQTWWYAFFFKLFGVSVLTAQCSNILLYIALMIFVYRFVRASWNQERAILTLLGIACYPSLQLYVLTTPYYFYIYLLLVSSFSLCLVRSLRHSLYSALGGVLAGLAALAKAVMLVAPGICLVFQFIAPNQSWPKRIKIFVLFAIVFLITLAPWNIRNYHVFQAFVPVCTSGGLVFYSANNPDSNGLYSPIPDHSVKGFSAAEFLCYSRECHKKGIAFIRNQPAQFIKLSLRKFLHTWGAETTFTELINDRGTAIPRMELLMNFLVQIGWSTLVFFCIRQYSYQRRTKGLILSSLELILAILLISQILIYMVFEGGARHHLSLVPILIIYATGKLTYSFSDSDASIIPRSSN